MPKRQGKAATKKRRKKGAKARAASRAAPRPPDVARDNTDPNLAEEAVQSSAVQLARVLANVSDVTYEVVTGGDPMAGKVVFVSPQVEELLGRRPQDFIQDDRLWFQLLHPDDVPSVVEATRNMHERRQPCTRCYRIRHRSTGEYRWFEDRAVPRLEGEGRVVGYFGAARDVTDRMASEEQLRFQADILRNVRNSVIVTDLEGRITYWNEEATAVFGYGREEMLGKTPARLYPDQDQSALAVDLERILQGADYLGEWLGRRKNGSPVWVDIRTTLLRDRDGRPAGFLGVSEDVTEKRGAEQHLHESEERYRTLFETANDAVYITRRSGRLLDVNEAAAELWGGPRDELLRLNVSELYADPRDQERFVEEIERQGALRNFEVSARRRDGSTRDCLLAASVWHAADGTVLGYQGIAHDITARKRVEDVVRASRDRLRALAAELHTVREKERTALSREIHDEFGQALTGLKMDLTWLLDHLATGPAALRGRVRAMLTLVDRSVEAARRVAALLRPAVLDSLGLAAAIEWLATDFAKHSGVECGCDVPAAEPPLSPDRVTALFRITQEALTNVARHAGAKHVDLRLAVTDGGVRLEVRDDGKGITEDQVSDVRSIGLIGMRERAGALGGRVYIQPGAERGTVVTVQMPFTAPAAPAVVP